ncbi:MATE family efflux transporter [Patescibacteria group bacterium]|jgi:MATE family multidrug resistance protein|nr:MATE family efflux transporter [Patescibacteria group bacterium]
MKTGWTERLARNLAFTVREMVTLARLSAPITLGLLGGSAFSAIDSYMLSPIGELALACASLTNSVLIIFCSAIFGLASPVGILAGNAYGARQSELIENVYRNGLVVALFGGLTLATIMLALLPFMGHVGQPSEVITALPEYWVAMALSLIPYSMSMVIKLLLDSIGQPWISALLSLLPAVVVVPLNWLLIYGNWGFPALGLVGAGIATLIAQVFGYFVLRLYLRYADGVAIPMFGGIDRARMIEFARHGLPMSLQYLAESGAIGVIGILIGLFGSVALAANQVALSLGELVYMIPLGVAGAVGILIAQATGEGAYARVRSLGVASFALVMLTTLPFGAAMMMFGKEIAALFVLDGEVASLLIVMLATIGAIQIVDGLQSVALGALRGLLDNRWPTAVALIAYWAVAMPMSIVLGFALHLGPVGVWSGFGFGVLFATLLLAYRFMQQTRQLAVTGN